MSPLVALVSLMLAGPLSVESSRRLAEPGVPTQTPDDQYSPSVAVQPDGGVALVVWTDTRRGGEDLFAMTLASDGSTNQRPLILRAGMQHLAAAAPHGSGDFIVAWEEASESGFSVHVARVNPTTLAPRLEVAIPLARAPSLAVDDSRGVLLGYVTTPASQMRPQFVAIDVDPLLDGLPPTRLAETSLALGSRALRTVFASRNGTMLVGIELVDDVVFFHGVTAVDLASAMVPAPSMRRRNPTVMLNTNNLAWIAFEYDSIPSTVAVFRIDQPGVAPVGSTFTGGTSPVLFQVKQTNTLATFNSATGLLQFMEVTQLGIPVPVLGARSFNPAGLAVGASYNPAIVAWEEGIAPERHIVIGSASVVSTSNVAFTENSPVAVEPQRDVQISFRGRRGVAVWRTSRNGLMGVWLRRNDGDRTLDLEATSFVIEDPDARFQGHDVALGEGEAVVVVRAIQSGQIVLQAWSVKRGDAPIPLTSVWPASSGASIETAPRVNFDGEHYRVAWRDQSAFNIVDLGEAHPGSQGTVQSLQFPAADAFDFDCLPMNGGCVITFDRAVPGISWWLSKTNEQSSTADMGSAPFAVTNDGTSFHAVWKLGSNLQAGSLTPGVGLSAGPSVGPPGRSTTAIRLSPGLDPWLAIQDGIDDGKVIVGHPVDFLLVGSGAGPDLSTIEEGVAAVGFTEFDVASSSLLPRVAIVVDDRVAPTMMTDGGVDGGSSETDAGTTTRPLELTSSSCACASVDAWALISGALLLISRRRRS